MKNSSGIIGAKSVDGMSVSVFAVSAESVAVHVIAVKSVENLVIRVIASIRLNL